MPPCQHTQLQTKCTSAGLSAGFKPRTSEQCLAATQHSGRLGKEYSDYNFLMPLDTMLNRETYPAPLVLPDDALEIEPDYAPQSLKSWMTFHRTMPVTPRQKTVYVIPPPGVSQEMAASMKGWTEPVIPTKQKAKGVPDDLAPPGTEEICEYLRAFYYPLEVKIMQGRYEWRTWEEDKRPKKRSKTAGTQASKAGFISLANTGPTGGLTRIRHRPSPDKIARQQLNLCDVTDAMMEDIPADAYSLVMLTEHDLYEDDDDDFCCGRAYGLSRVAVVSLFRYNPALTKYAGVDLEHMWPASHCKAYVEKMGGLAGEEGGEEGEETEEEQKTAPLSAAIAAAAPFMKPRNRESLSALWLARSCRTASHELGHCFGLDHCVYRACVMQGTANVAEDDRQPPYLCFVCATKLSWGLAPHMGEGGVIIALQGRWAQRQREGLGEYCKRYEGRTGMFEGLRAWIDAQGGENEGRTN